MKKDYSELDNHMDLFDSLLGDEQSINREIRYDYDVDRDSRPKSLKPGREFFRVQITTRNINHNPIRFSWFYHSDENADKWYITSLSLRGLGLPRFELSIIQELADLEYINLQGNGLSEIDFNNFCNAKKLHTINLSGNNIEKLMNIGICELYELRYLSAENNKITSVDLNHLANFIQLNRIILASNRLQTIDLSPLAELPYLVTLDISRNQLTELKLTLKNIRLKNIIANDNKIGYIELDSYLPNLTVLQLSNNELNSISCKKILVNMPSLSKLLAWGNRITSFELNQTMNHDLEVINLNSNLIEDVNMSGCFDKLEIIELAYNSIRTLDFAQLIAPKLRIINLSLNPLSKIILPDLDSSGDLEIVDLMGTEIEELILKSKNPEILELGNEKIGKYSYNVIVFNNIKFQIPMGTKIIVQ